MGRIVPLVVSTVIGATCGVIQGEVTANSLIEITQTRAFAIVFGLGFLALAAALLWRAWRSRDRVLRSGLLAAFALLIVASAAACFAVTDSVHDLSVGAKVPLFCLQASTIAFALAFCFVEAINAGVCDKCTPGDSPPIIRSRKQVAVLFGASVALGCVFGILFGTFKVEQESPSHSKFKQLLLWTLPLGLIVGGAAGFCNQILRERFSTEDEYRPVFRAVDDAERNYDTL